MRRYHVEARHGGLEIAVEEVEAEGQDQQGAEHSREDGSRPAGESPEPQSLEIEADDRGVRLRLKVGPGEQGAEP